MFQINVIEAKKKTDILMVVRIVFKTQSVISGRLLTASMVLAIFELWYRNDSLVEYIFPSTYGYIEMNTVETNPDDAYMYLVNTLFPCQMLSLIEAQAQFFQYGHQSLSELEDFKFSLGEEVSG